jgi:hypothetical protein
MLIQGKENLLILPSKNEKPAKAYDFSWFKKYKQVIECVSPFLLIMEDLINSQRSIR